MSADLSGYSIESEYLHVCKEYCKPGEVIVERIPRTVGISITITFLPFHKKYPVRIRTSGPVQILWLNMFIRKEKRHRNGKVVFKHKSPIKI